jgi:hypothetical protein
MLVNDALKVISNKPQYIIKFQIETMDLFLDPKGKPGTNQLMFYYQEPEDREPHGMYLLLSWRLQNVCFYEIGVPDHIEVEHVLLHQCLLVEKMCYFF